MTDSTEVKLHFLDYWRVIRARLGIIILTFLLTMITAWVTVYFMPRQYFSKATIEVKQNQFQIFQGGGDYQGVSDPRVTQTQFQIIQQKDILYPVIDSLNLTKVWANGGPQMEEEQAYYRLLSMLEMHDIRQTDLIEIGVWDTDAKEAATISNAIAFAYQDRRRADEANQVNSGLIQLRDEVADQRKEVTDLGAAAAKIRVEQGIVDADPESMGADTGLDTVDVRAIANQVDDARLKTAEEQTQLDQVDKLKPEELMVALHMLDIDDPTVMKILPLYQDTVSEEAQLLNSGLGPNHPKIKALRAVKDVYSEQLNEQITAIRASLATKLELAKSTQKVLEARLDQARADFTAHKNASSNYTDAKYRYLESKHLLEAAEQRLNTEEMQVQITPMVARVWGKAEPALSPGKPRVLLYMLLASLVGVVLGVGLAFFLEYLDTSVKSLEDVERFLGVPVLAVVPKDIGILMHQAGDSPDAEVYRILRTNIEFNRKSPDANTLTLVSGGPGEGKSTTLFNLAYTCAKGGYSVLVVDADLRRPSQHRLFGVENNVGLSNYLTSNMSFEEVVRSTGVENLSFIPSGQLPHDAMGILNSQRMTDLIRNAKRKYDMVLLDSPPILSVSDGAVLASEVDMAIMVIEHRRFPRSMLQRVKQAISNVGGNLLGVVLNKVDTKHDTGYGYYGGYYNYYAPNGADQPAQPAANGAPGATPAPGAPTAPGSGKPATHPEPHIHGEQY